MQLEWKIGETYETDRPADLEIGVKRVKIRKNIRRETRTTQDGKRSVWAYEYADMTPAQYSRYKEELAQLDTPFAQMIRENSMNELEAIADLYEQQIMAQENQQAIMEGIADIYEQGERV